MNECYSVSSALLFFLGPAKVAWVGNGGQGQARKHTRTKAEAQSTQGRDHSETLLACLLSFYYYFYL
jgi:hypothetical protein